jgi:hypothetical protein
MKGSLAFVRDDKKERFIAIYGVYKIDLNSFAIHMDKF